MYVRGKGTCCGKHFARDVVAPCCVPSGSHVDPKVKGIGVYYFCGTVRLSCRRDCTYNANIGEEQTQQIGDVLNKNKPNVEPTT